MAYAAALFYAERDARILMGKRTANGMHATLNELLVESF